MRKPAGWRNDPARHSLAAQGVETKGQKAPPGSRGFSPKQVSISLDAAQYFEYNVTYDEWMELWQKYGGYKSVGEHVWHRMQERGLLHAFGKGDYETRRIISKMVLDRAKREDPHVFTSPG